MAGQYAVLKDAIQAVIKTNGNKEITGALMQQSLVAMIASLGAYFQFVDVATPSTNPGTPDQNVMYFAGTAGTYTNFGGIVVNEGEFCALCWNGSWIKKTTGAATAEQVTALGRKIDGLALGKFYGFIDNVASLPVGDENGYAYVGASSPYAVYNFLNGIWTDSGAVEQYDPPVPNMEDIDYNGDGELQFANRSVGAGMGYKILRTGSGFSAQVTDTNTIYEIRYDFDLGGNSFTMPSGCVLRFNGGSISNGTLIGTSTTIEAPLKKIFSGISLSGTFGRAIHSAWFIDGTTPATNDSILSALIPSINAMGDVDFYVDDDIYFSSPLVFGYECNIFCKGDFVYSGALVATAITIGNASNRSLNRKYRLRVRQATNADYVGGNIPENYGIQIINAERGEITIDYVHGFAYGTAFIGDTKGVAYNTIYLNEFGSYYYNALLLRSKNSGFVNENLFIGGMLHVYSNAPFKNNNIGIFLDGLGNTLNNNTFLKTCIEGSVVGIKLNNADNNNFLFLRDEAVGTIMQSNNNWTSGRNLYFSGYEVVGKTSPFNNNWVSRTKLFYLGDRKLYDLEVKIYKGADYYQSNLLITSFYRKTYNNPVSSTALSVVFAGVMLDTSEIKDWRIEYDKPGRCFVRMYDENGDLLESSTPNQYVDTQYPPDISSSYPWQFSSNSDHLSYSFGFHAEVKKVFLACRCDTTRRIKIFTKSEAKFQAAPATFNEVLEKPTSVNDMVRIGDMVFFNGKPIYFATIANDGSCTMVDATGASV